MEQTRQVAFFSNQFAARGGTGVAQYARNLVDAMRRSEPAFRLTPVATWSNRGPAELAEVKAASGLEILSTGRVPTRLLWSTLHYPYIEQLLETHVDIVHTNDLDYAVATRRPYAVTVHDIGPLVHPEYFQRDAALFMRRNLQYSIRRADAFICVSRATEELLLAYAADRWGVDLSGRSHVTLEGISQVFRSQPDPRELEGLPYDFSGAPFILAAGKLSPRKNLAAVIRALKRLEDRIPHHLITVGGSGWDFEETIRLVDTLGLSGRVHFLGYVTDSQLRALYARADLFIYPSLFEGFGLPVLEAMASGCIVITSNVSSLPEVAGDAALLVDPHDQAEITAAVEAVCMNPGAYAHFKTRGIERARGFTWQACAAATANVYRGLFP